MTSVVRLYLAGSVEGEVAKLTPFLNPSFRYEKYIAPRLMNHLRIRRARPYGVLPCEVFANSSGRLDEYATLQANQRDIMSMRQDVLKRLWRTGKLCERARKRMQGGTVSEENRQRSLQCRGGVRLFIRRRKVWGLKFDEPCPDSFL
jgi:hypothetical protein